MRFSSFISIVLEPMIVLGFTALVGGIHAGLSGLPFFGYLAYICLFLGVVVVVRLVMVKKDKTNWDVSTRTKRIKPLAILVTVFLLNITVISLWKNNQLTEVFTAWLYWILGFSLISLKTKISGHVSVLTLSVGLLVHWYGATLVPLIVLIPLLAWSRLVLKRHTMVEVIGGFLYSLILLIFIRYIG